MQENKVIVFMGKSGSGKGTQAEILKGYLEKKGKKVLYIETGTAFRELAQKESFTGRTLAKTMETGNLTPIFLPIWAWTSALVEKYTGEEHVIFDGLARRELEAPILDSAMEFYGVEHINILHINVSDDWARERLLGRGREDDHEESIAKRLAWFKENTMPAIEYFKKNERGHYHEINGEQSVEDVHQNVADALDL